MRLNDCIIDCPLTGECKIDLPIALKTFDKRCSISKWHDEYTLVRSIYKQCHSMKIKISENDALSLITELQLVEIKSLIFRNASTFILGE
jgi:hypothetical protein